MDSLNRDLIEQVRADLARIDRFTKAVRKQHISIGQQLELFRQTFGMSGFGWKKFIEEESGFDITVRFANRLRNVAKAMSEPGSEKTYEGMTLAAIERAYLRAKKEAKLS